ncbi:MAG: 2-phospho-L-lactate transferase CofD family protein [Thermodesulfobacteriota bacterium]
MKAIKGADYIIIGRNDLFTSIIPNLIVSGVKEVLQETSAKILSIINIMTKFGEPTISPVLILFKNLRNRLSGRLME